MTANWRDVGNCSAMSSVLAVPEEEWTENQPLNGEEPKTPTDDERVKRSIWYYFFEGYEIDPQIQQETDAMCFSCPVISLCFDWGTKTSQTGVHGGVYLNRGKIDENKNAHKTEVQWAQLEVLLNGIDR